MTVYSIKTFKMALWTSFSLGMFLTCQHPLDLFLYDATRITPMATCAITTMVDFLHRRRPENEAFAAGPGVAVEVVVVGQEEDRAVHTPNTNILALSAQKIGAAVMTAIALRMNLAVHVLVTAEILVLVRIDMVVMIPAII
jgi:hypothetical protein